MQRAGACSSTRQIDSLRVEVQRLSSDKDVLKRAVKAQYPTNLPPPSSPSSTRHERELALLQENDRLREALAWAQRHPSPFRSYSLPSPEQHLPKYRPLPLTPAQSLCDRLEFPPSHARPVVISNVHFISWLQRARRRGELVRFRSRPTSPITSIILPAFAYCTK